MNPNISSFPLINFKKRERFMSAVSSVLLSRLLDNLRNSKLIFLNSNLFIYPPHSTDKIPLPLRHNKEPSLCDHSKNK